jgi:hypothetical protein
MRSEPRCYLHIGAPKTGSTLLQRVCFENRGVLEAQGVLYPDVSLRGYGHHDLAFLLSGGYPTWATPQPRSLSELAADLRSSVHGHNGSILLSSEDFYLFPNPSGLMEFLTSTGALENRKPIVIAYVRRQDDAHESWYNQTIKAQGYTHDVETCISEFRDLFDYCKQLSAWADVFGRNSLIVRPFEPPEFNRGDLLDDFLSTVGVDSSVLAVTVERINTSLNRDILEFQRILNALPLDVRTRRRFHHQLMELTSRTVGASLFDERPMIDPRKRAEILESYAESNRETARTYLARDLLFSQTQQEIEAHSLVEPGLNVKKLAAIVGWLLLQGD